ncbi:hypothetical protein CAPTEDRAFT_121027 [Capitella teleta]|uniref:Uncharacterized protein n=1 Tax=Capitella teleta TaxID=283909 RepID=R7VA12_CAPTE|nr:hypothetical protein CAPTEDRAFT_121027 [Capitella teleta]|eukprot:ELU15449.1 hypothetical protein CAPTEDRAFT_121027 [Capitella teleta]
MGDHKSSFLVPIVMSCLLMLAMFAFNALSSIAGGVFVNSTGDISDLWYSSITPSGITFAIWGLIYAWLVVFIIYVLSSLCRKGIQGRPLYMSPALLPPSMFYILAINFSLNISWLFMFDRSMESNNYLIASVVILFLMPVTLYTCIGITCYTVNKYQVVLRKYSLIKEVWMIHFMVQNAFGIYAGWTTIATVLNLGAVLTYVVNIEEETTALIQLGILSIEILFWFLLDLFALDKFTRYLFTPHFVLVWAFTGSFMKNVIGDESEPHAVFITCLLALSGFALLTKIIAMIYRSVKRPLYQDDVVNPTLEEGGVSVDKH